MLTGSLMTKIWKFALPLAVGNCLQQLFFTLDIVVIGRFASSEALAAVGSTGVLINLLLNLFIGLSVGANVIIARHIGENDKTACQQASVTTISVAVIGGILLLFLGLFLAQPLLELVDTPLNIIEKSTLYFRLYFLGVPFVLLYNFGASILRSAGDTKRPLYILIFTGFLHAVLNIILVIPCGMDVAGVGIATLFSNFLNAVLILWLLARENDWIRVRLSKLAVYARELKQIIWIGIPAGIQGIVFSISNVCIQSSVNSFGSDGTAGSVAALTFEYFAFFMTVSFSAAATTFVSQNFGAKLYQRCRKSLLYAAISGGIACELVAMMFVLGRSFWLGLVTEDPAVTVYAASRITHVLMFEALTVTYEVTGAALRGIGYSIVPALLTIFGTCIFRIIWVFSVCEQYHDFDVLMSAYPISWVLTGTLVIAAWIFISRRKLPV